MSVIDQVVNAPVPSVSVANAGTREAFLDAWVRTLSEHAKYLRTSGATLKAPVVVAYVDNTGAFAEEHSWPKKPMLGSSHRDNFAGKLIVATGNVGACEHGSRFADTDEFHAAIAEVGLQRAPTVALMSENKLWIWANGLDDDVSPFERELGSDAVIIDLDVIDRSLARFYDDIARQNKKWWMDPPRRVTVSSPEAVVQYDLWVFLMARHSEGAFIKQETDSGNGRSDIVVIPLPQRSAVGSMSAVLELKTVRDCFTPSAKNKTGKLTKIKAQDNVEWACSGVQQAAAYRDNERLDGAFLCVYDFCANNHSGDIERAVEPHANQYSVMHRVYPVTASHEEHRGNAYPLVSPQ
jgi:hypothetical protein